MYTQRNVEALIFWFCLFPSSCGFFQREACLFRDKPRLLRHSSSLSLIHKPDGSSFSAFSFCLFFALWFDFSSLLSSFFLPYVLSPPLLLCFLLLLVLFFLSVFFNLANISLFISSFLFYLNLAEFPRPSTATCIPDRMAVPCSDKVIKNWL